MAGQLEKLFTCMACGRTVAAKDCAFDVGIEFQGTIPLLVFYNRCPLCAYEWADAHEPCLPDDHPQIPGT